MAAVTDLERESSKDSNVNLEQKKATAYLWRGYCDNLNITAYNLFSKVNITQIALGTSHSLFLTEDGDVFVNGENVLGQLGLGTPNNRVAEEPIKVEKLSAPCVYIACGSFHNAVVTHTGQVFCWGSSRDGQCGTGSLDIVSVPTAVKVEINEGFCQHGVPKPATSVAVSNVACGASHTLAVSLGGEVWAWGAGPQLGLGELKHAPVPRRVDSLQGQVAIAVTCGGKHSMALVLRQEKSPSRTASPRASPLKGKAEARDVKEDKLYPSRCSTCNKEIYTYTDTNDMCIIDELHSCTVSDTAMSIDSTLVEEVSMSSSSASEVLKKSPSPENEGPNDITAQKGSGETIGDGQDAVEQETVTAQRGSDGTNGDGQHTVEQETSSSLQLKGQGNSDAQEGLVEDSSFSDMSALDLSVLVVSGESPFDDASITPTKLPPIPESDVTSSSEVGTTEGADTSKSDGSDEEVWKRRQSETDDGDEELKTLYNKQQRVRSPSTTSLRSLNLAKQSEALDYLQRQFEDDKVISQSTRADSEMTAAAPKVDKTQTSLGNMFDMMAQVKSMTSKAITNIQTFSGFGSSVVEEVTAEKAKSDTELATCVSQPEGPEMKGSPDLKPDQAAKKSGTFIEWSREMATFDDDPSSLTRDLSRKSLRTIEMQQKNLSRSLSSTEILPQAKIVTATDVWSWGANDQGQLGLGDQLERSTPALIKYFLGRHVIKLAAGDSHSLAVTANSQVFSWGLNSYGQLGQPETVYGPTKVKFVKGFTPWDIAAGQAHSVFLGDSLDISGSSQLNVMYCGKQPSREQHESMKKTSTAVPLPQIKQLGLITKIAAGGSSCACKILSAAIPSSETIFELAASERAFYAQLIKTTNLLLRPLQKSAFYTVMDVYPYKSSLQNMVSSFGTLTKKIGEGITDLTRCIQSSKPIDQCQMLAGHVQFVEAFRLYSCSFSDFLAVGGFDYCSRAGSEFFEKIQQDSIKDLSSETDKNVGACTLFMRAMRYPFFRLAEYSKFFNKIASAAEKKEMKDQIQNVILDWDALKVNFSAEHKLAEATRVFWEISSPKVLDNFKTPNRRVLRDSRTHPLTWPAGGRFAYRLFVLFNDGFLHAQNTGQILMPLETLWVESGASDAEMVNTITVISPEDRFELQVSTPAQKAEWLIAFNSAISKALTTHKPMTKRNSGERFTPPLIRTASHKFVKPGIYKDASYEGSWLSGKVHGSGVMKWSDGSVFEGDFKKGLMHGSGVFTLVKSSGQEVQKGQWKDGKLNGKGSISYANGDLYEGYFQDGQRFGHGMLQTGRQRSNCSSVYIGEWLNNMKEGYGVQDDILKGEKYMGMWVEGYRHGSGVLVTLDGMYFEGTFVQNKLTGFGVMISDDNTLYEGDFVGTTYLSGKGVLTLPTGDKLEGNFSGSLNEGLKIHGTFIKSSASSDGDRKSSLHVGGIKSKYFGRLCVSADNKWEDIFSHTWSTLGQNVVTSSQFQANTDKAWELVAVMVTSGRKTLKAMSGISPTKLKVQQNTLEELAKIPAHGSEKLTVEVVHEISAYLTKAFDTVYHPLGQLMETLVDVFRASYIGIGAHPRLLHHAIQEVMSYVRRLYKVVRVLFPALPANGGPVHVYPQSQMKDIARTTEEAQEFIEGLEVEDPNIFVLTSAGLLYPILLPKIYPPLFDLYALYNEANDDRYWERVTKLNRQSDMGLMAYLGIEQRFWLMDDILQQGKTQKLSTIKDVCYAEAVDALQQLSTAFSPLEKLKIIEQSFNEITKTVTQSLKDDHMWCMDDLFPIFQFVVVRAKIHHLGAEIQIIEDLMEPHLEHGELGLMFTTLKACYFQVQNEKLPHQ